MNSVRWLPFARADGVTNMAADDVLLDAAAVQGRAALRFYGWSQATVSLGYFQLAAARALQARLASLPWVRRSSGGKALLHHHELTYALALPPGFSADWLARMHQRVILPALNRLGLAGQLEIVGSESRLLGEFLCFQQQTAGDLTCAGHKVVGSAQRKQRRCLLQHGAILLAASDYAPELPGIKELTGVELTVPEVEEAILDEFRRETGWRGQEEGWTAAELREIKEKVGRQYGVVSWNEKR